MTSSLVRPTPPIVTYPALLEDCLEGEVVLATDEKRGIVLVSICAMRPVGFECYSPEGWHNCSEWKGLPPGTAVKFL